MSTTKYSEQILRDVVAKSFSISETLRNLGLSGVSGAMHSHIKRRIKYFRIDTSHFIANNKGRTLSVRKNLLVVNDGRYKTHSTHLRRAMIDAGIPYECTTCVISEWQGKKLRLHIEHKNGNNRDDRQDNLEFLCPNCHSQTPTYARMK
jgi:hypothetical protein